MANTEFEGIDKVIKRIDELADVEGYKAAMKKACALVEREAKKKAPKDTGELRRSISSKLEITENEILGIVYSALLYAPYIEYGTGLFAENGGRVDVPWNYRDDKGEWHTTSGMKPQPYMRPALNECREEIVRILKEGGKND